MSEKKQSKAKKPDELAALTEDLQRLQADFVNYKRRIEDERSQVVTFAKQEVLTQILPVIDNLERALSHMPKELERNDWAKGVSQVAKQVTGQLEQLDVRRIVTVGEEFDPNFHEAVQMEDGDGDREVITDELQAGYILGEQVIRHAIVKVKRSK